jgi:hypothetical protein
MEIYKSYECDEIPVLFHLASLLLVFRTAYGCEQIVFLMVCEPVQSLWVHFESPDFEAVAFEKQSPTLLMRVAPLACVSIVLAQQT